MYILLMLSATLIGFGTYHVLCSVTNVPSAKASKMMMLAVKQKSLKKGNLFDVYITTFAQKISRFVRLDQLQRIKIQIALDATGQNISPETYFIKSCVKALLIILCGIPFLFIMPLVFLVFLALGIMIWLSAYYSALDFAKKRRRKIEAELPRFTAALSQHLQSSRDVLGFLISYRKVAGKELGQELNTTIAEMKTGNYEQALIHMEARIGSSLLTDITRGLIGTIRGDDQSMYFRMLSFDMRQLEQAALKKEAAKRPKKIQKYSMLLLLCILIIYAVVLGTEIVHSLSIVFG